MGGRKTSLLLTGLEPDTPYTVSVVAVYPTATSGEVTAAGRTSESSTSSSTYSIFLLFYKHMPT